MIHRHSFESKGKGKKEHQLKKGRRRRRRSNRHSKSLITFARSDTYITIRAEEVEEGTQPSDDNFLDWLFKL